MVVHRLNPSAMTKPRIPSQAQAMQDHQLLRRVSIRDLVASNEGTSRPGRYQKIVNVCANEQDKALILPFHCSTELSVTWRPRPLTQTLTPRQSASVSGALSHKLKYR